jgi:hypothetical protein
MWSDLAGVLDLGVVGRTQTHAVPLVNASCTATAQVTTQWGNVPEWSEAYELFTA